MKIRVGVVIRAVESAERCDPRHMIQDQVHDHGDASLVGRVGQPFEIVGATIHGLRGKMEGGVIAPSPRAGRFGINGSHIPCVDFIRFVRVVISSLRNPAYSPVDSSALRLIRRVVVVSFST